MTRDEIEQQLSHENISTTIRTLVAIDSFQGIMYSRDHELEIRKVAPHSEATVMEMANAVLTQFTYLAPAGNAHGVRMLSSAFANSLKLSGMMKEFDWAMQACPNN